MEADDSRDRVGPVLRPSPLTAAVLAAIVERHPDAEIVDRGAYLRVLVPRTCVLVRALVERHAGARFALPGDLEQIMPSFKGRFRVDADQASWEAGPWR